MRRLVLCLGFHLEIGQLNSSQPRRKNRMGYSISPVVIDGRTAAAGPSSRSLRADSFGFAERQGKRCRA